MRCPTCREEYEEHVRACATCGRPLSTLDEPLTAAVTHAHLGTFHPAMAREVAALLEGRAIVHDVRERPEGIEIVVDRGWRDDLRAELTMSWPDLLEGLDPAAAIGLRSGGGSAPGWLDAPRGGHVDRVGRLVVEPGDVEEQEADDARVVGPALLTAGAIAGIAGWYLLDLTGLVVIGVLLALIGVLTPR